MTEGFQIDFDLVHRISSTGRLGEWLNSVPHSAWRSTSADGRTLLFYACNSSSADNLRALHRLIRSGVSIHVRDECGFSVSGYATRLGNADALSVLIAYGANPRETDSLGVELMDLACAPVFRQPTRAVARLLIAHGVRLRESPYVFPRLWALERGRARCRSVVCAMLGLKRFHSSHFRHVDRFLFREIARSIWATLCDEQWQLLTPL